MNIHDFIKIKSKIKIMGVYALINQTNNKIYVGQSIDIHKRIKNHLLKTHQHNKELFADLQVYEFHVKILEIVNDKNVLYAREAFWIKKLNAINDGYNKLIAQGIGYFDRHGEAHPNHKLTEEDVINIRKRRLNGESRKQVFADYQHLINFTGFSKVWLCNTWPNVGHTVFKTKPKPPPISEEVKTSILQAKHNGKRYSETRKLFSTLTKKQFDRIWYNI